MTHRLRFGSSAGLLLLAALVVCVLAMPALAHARYVGSDPSDGEKLSSPPSEVSAEYSEPLEPDSHMEVYNACGQRVDGGDVRVTGYEMAVSMSSDSSGTYVVAWTAASAIDPHVTKGNFTFTVTQGTDCNTASQQPPEEDEEQGPGSDPQRPSNDDARPDATSGSGEEQTASERGGPADKKLRGKHTNHKNMRRAARASAREPVAQAQTQTPSEQDETSDDIPMSSLLVALGMSVVIGASGGWIYAGLLGPRR